MTSPSPWHNDLHTSQMVVSRLLSGFENEGCFHCIETPPKWPPYVRGAT
jgi:hypothetical protein